MDFSDKLIELLDSGNDILGKLYYNKMAMTASRRPDCLSSVDFQKCRSPIFTSKTWPSVPTRG